MELILTSNNINIDITPPHTMNTEVIVTPTSNLTVQPSDTIQVNITPSKVINTEIIAPSAIDLTFTDVGVQGPRGIQGEKGDKGDIGNPLSFELLTEQQKIELRGDVGPTSTNLVNIFYDSLLA